MTMRKIVFDIETKNTFHDVGKKDPALLDISLVGIHDSETGYYDSFLEDDLPRLWPILERADLLIGFNSDHFDIPLLDKYYPGDLTRVRSVDIMKEIRNVLGRRIGLDAIAEATLGKAKTGNGLDAIRWFKEGAMDKIRDYCLADVALTKELYDYARSNGFLKYRDFGEIREIPLDTSGWEARERVQMTHTLPF